MDLDFNEQQKLFRDTVRVFYRKEYPPRLAREIREGVTVFPLDLRKKMASLGWYGIIFPWEYDGAGGDFLDLALLLEEMGRVCFFSPFFSTVIMAGLLILDAGDSRQKKEFIPKIAKGELTLTVAVTEISGKWDPCDIAARATLEGRQYSVEGTKSFVPYAPMSDYIVSVARTDEKAKKGTGMTIFLVNAKDANISVSSLRTIADEQLSIVNFDKVKVPTGDVLGAPNEGWAYVEKMLDRVVIARCCEMVGGAGKVLEMTVEYAKARKQFDRPIGSFQAIQHHCADMSIYVDASRMITYRAAWKLARNLSCTLEAAMAKAWVSEAYRRVALLGHQVHAGVGFCEEHELPLYFRHAKANEALFGDPDYHRERVAQQFLDV